MAYAAGSHVRTHRGRILALRCARRHAAGCLGTCRCDGAGTTARCPAHGATSVAESALKAICEACELSVAHRLVARGGDELLRSDD